MKQTLNFPDKRAELWAGLKRHYGSIGRLQNAAGVDRVWLRRIFVTLEYRNPRIEALAAEIVAELDAELAKYAERIEAATATA